MKRQVNHIHVVYWLLAR